MTSLVLMKSLVVGILVENYYLAESIGLFFFLFHFYFRFLFMFCFPPIIFPDAKKGVTKDPAQNVI